MGMNERGNGSGGLVIVIAILIALPVLYVASCGPVAWLLSGIEGGADVYNAIYRPLRILEGTWVGEAIANYAAWWYPPHPLRQYQS